MTRNAKDQQKHAEPKQLNSDKERVKDSSLPDLDLNLDDDEALLAALEDALQADVGQAASATSSTKDANAASKTESTEHAQSTPAAAQTAQRATALQAESSAAQAEVEKRSVGAAAELAADLAAESVAESVAESATVTTASDNAHLETKGITSDVTSVNQMAADASAVTSEQAAAPQDASHAGAAAAAAAAETVVADAGDAAVDADAAASVAADAADAAASAAAVAANETTDGAALEKIDAQDQDNPLNVFISPQGVLGVGRANALHTKPAAGAHLDKGFGRTNIDADFLQANSNVELPNGHKFHLRQLMPEIAKLSTAQEQKLEHDFNAGFAHYANEMLITRSLEELGTKPYEALSADYLRQIIQELAPDLSPNYIMKFASLLDAPPDVELYNNRLDDILRGLEGDELENFTIFSLCYMPESAVHHEELIALRQSFLEQLCRYEWVVAVMVADFWSRITPQQLDEMVFYYYLLAQTTGEQRDFVFLDHLVEVQNCVQLFALMRYGFTHEVDFMAGFCYGRDSKGMVVDRIKGDNFLAQRDFAQTRGSILGPDLTVGGELNDCTQELETKDLISLQDYVRLDGDFDLDPEHTEYSPAYKARSAQTGKRAKNQAFELTAEKIRQYYRRRLRDFLARNKDKDPLHHDTEALRAQFAKGDLDTRCAYTTYKELCQEKPILQHFCYLSGVLNFLNDNTNDIDILIYQIRQVATIVMHRSSQDLYGSNIAEVTHFLPSLCNFLIGKKACRVGFYAMQEGSAKIANEETLGMFLFELFGNTENLNQEQMAEYEFAFKYCSKEDIEQAVKTGTCGDDVKECALHLYHQLKIRQKIDDPERLMYFFKDKPELEHLAHKFNLKLLDIFSFYSKTLINNARRQMLSNNSSLAGEFFFNQYEQVMESAFAVGLSTQGESIQGQQGASAGVSASAGASAGVSASVQTDSQDEDEEDKKFRLAGETGFVPLIPGMSAYTAFLIGRAYTYGELLPFNRFLGYAALSYATVSGDYLAPGYLSLCFEPLLNTSQNKPGMISLCLHLMACQNLMLARSGIETAFNRFAVVNAYQLQVSPIDYNTAFKLWQESDSLLKPIFERNPNLLRPEADESFARTPLRADFASAVISNTVILLCDILDHSQQKSLQLAPVLNGLLKQLYNCLENTFSPDACLAMYRVMVSRIYNDDLQTGINFVKAQDARFLGDLLAKQLLVGQDNISDCTVINAKVEPLDIAFMFLQLGMVTPEYREQGYNLLSLSFNTIMGNMAPVFAPYMDEFFRSAAALQNGKVLSYLSSIKKAQSGQCEQVGKATASMVSSVTQSAIEAHQALGAEALQVESTASAAGISASAAAGIEGAGAVGAASAAGAAGAGAAGSAGAAETAGAFADMATDCGELSSLFALLGRRFQSDGCYRDAVHFYQQHGLDEERLKLAYEMVALQRPLGYFELYLNLKDQEELRAEAHTYLFYAARLQVSEAQAELEALLKTKSFKPLPFVIYWLYLEELAQHNVQALLCLMYLSLGGLVVPFNSFKFARLLEQHASLFSGSQLHRILNNLGLFQTSHNYYHINAGLGAFNLFNNECDNLGFIGTEQHGNFAALNGEMELHDFLLSKHLEREITDPQVQQVLFKMFVRLGKGQSLLERRIFANMVQEGVWPTSLRTLLNKAADVSFAHNNESADSAEIDNVMKEVVLSLDNLSAHLCMHSPLGIVYQHVRHPMTNHTLYRSNILPCINMGALPLSLTSMLVCTLQAVREDGRPLPVLFARMCRFLSNLGYLVPSFYSHSNVTIYEHAPYGELFEHYVVGPQRRDLLQAAELLGKVSQEGELLRCLLAQLQKQEMQLYITVDQAREDAITKGNSAAEALAAATDLAEMLDPARRVASGAKHSGQRDASSRSEMADGSSGAAIEVEAINEDAASKDMALNLRIKLFTEALSLTAESGQKLDLDKFLPIAQRFVQAYTDDVEHGLSDLRSVAYDDYVYLMAIFANVFGLVNDFQQMKEQLKQDPSLSGKLPLVHFGATSPLDLQRLLYAENEHYAEALKSYIALHGEEAQQAQGVPKLKLQLPQLRFGNLGVLEVPNLSADQEHVLSLFIKAYLRYEFFMHSHGYDLREMLLFSRNGWCLGKSTQDYMPTRSYASLLAKDMLRGIPEAKERYLYYTQSHLFKYALNDNYFREEEEYLTARKFVQEVLQLDTNSEKFREFAHDMNSEGFSEFEDLRLECENGYVAKRRHIKLPEQNYDHVSGYVSYKNQLCDETLLEQNRARRAREQLKQMAAAVDALHEFTPAGRELYFNGSDDQLRNKQGSVVVKYDQMTPDIHDEFVHYRWGPVELRVHLERVLGKDNLATLCKMPNAQHWLHYTFTNNGRFDQQQYLQFVPYACALLPYRLLQGLSVADRSKAVAYMQSLKSSFAGHTSASALGAASAGSASSLVNTASVADSHMSGEVSMQHLAQMLLNDDLYRTEMWGLSFDQRLSRWHQSKEELMLAIGREYSAYQQEFLRLRSYDSVYSESSYQLHSLVWHLHRHDSAGHESSGASARFSSASYTDTAASVAASSVATAASVDSVFTPAVGDFNEEWQKQEENALLAALQNGEEYRGNLFVTTDYSEELKRSDKQKAQMLGQYFPIDREGSYYALDNDGSLGSGEPAVSLTTATASAVAAAAAANNGPVTATAQGALAQRASASASGAGATSRKFNAQVLRQFLERLGLDPSKIEPQDLATVLASDQVATMIAALKAAADSSDGSKSFGPVTVNANTSGANSSGGMDASATSDGEEELIFTRLKSFLNDKLGLNVDSLSDKTTAARAIENLANISFMSELADDMGSGAEGLDSNKVVAGVGAGTNVSASAGANGGKTLRDELDFSNSTLSRFWHEKFTFDLRQEWQFTRPLMFYEEENPLHVFIYCLAQELKGNVSHVETMREEEKLANVLLNYSYFYGAVDLIDMSFTSLLYETFHHRFYRSVALSDVTSAINEYIDRVFEQNFDKQEIDALLRAKDKQHNKATQQLAKWMFMPENTPKQLLIDVAARYVEDLIVQNTYYYKSLMLANRKQMREGYLVLADDSYMHPIFFDLMNDPLLNLRAPSVLHKIYPDAYKLAHNIVLVALAQRFDQGLEMLCQDPKILQLYSKEERLVKFLEEHVNDIMSGKQRLPYHEFKAAMQCMGLQADGLVHLPVGYPQGITWLDYAPYREQHIETNCAVGVTASGQKIIITKIPSPEFAEQTLKLATCLLYGYYEDERELLLHEDLLIPEDPRKFIYPCHYWSMWSDEASDAQNKYEQEIQIYNFFHPMLLGVQKKPQMPFVKSQAQMISEVLEVTGLEEKYRELQARRKKSGKERLYRLSELAAKRAGGDGVKPVKDKDIDPALIQQLASDSLAVKGNKKIQQAILQAVAQSENYDFINNILNPEVLSVARERSQDDYIELLYLRAKYFLSFIYKELPGFEFVDLAQPLLDESKYYCLMPLFVKTSKMQEFLHKLHLNGDTNVVPFAREALYYGERVEGHAQPTWPIPGSVRRVNYLYRLYLSHSVLNGEYDYHPSFPSVAQYRSLALSSSDLEMSAKQYKYYQDYIIQHPTSNTAMSESMSISPEQQTLWLMDYLQGRTLSEQILLMDYFQLERQQSPVDSSYFDRHAPTAYAAQLMRNRWWSATPVQEDSSAQKQNQQGAQDPQVQKASTSAAASVPASVPAIVQVKSPAQAKSANSYEVVNPDDDDYEQELSFDDFDVDDFDPESSPVLMTPEEMELFQEFLDSHHINPMDVEALADALVQCHMEQLGEHGASSKARTGEDFDADQALSDMDADNDQRQRQRARKAQARGYSQGQGNGQGQSQGQGQGQAAGHRSKRKAKRSFDSNRERRDGPAGRDGRNGQAGRDGQASRDSRINDSGASGSGQQGQQRRNSKK